MIKATIWNEFIHEQKDKAVIDIYPEGIHATIADFLQSAGIHTSAATLQMPEHGLTQEVLDNTDVLIWWGHKGHHEVDDAIVDRVYHAVLKGMGLIALHSSHFSKIFKKLMGTSCDLKWRCADEKERVWINDPSHPIARGLPEYFDIEEEEMYGEHFDIPTPDELVMISWFKGGEVFRSGCTYKRGNGRIFYFRPGHETNPSYHNKHVQQVIINAVKWAADKKAEYPKYGNHKPLEVLE